MIERRGGILYYDKSDSRESVEAAIAEIKSDHESRLRYPERYWGWRPTLIFWALIRSFQPKERR
jgi:hypothetical protein